LAAYLRSVIATNITISAPDRVRAGEHFTTSGVLRRSDTNEGLAGQTINVPVLPELELVLYAMATVPVLAIGGVIAYNELTKRR
jgi:hypothetical protein